jgi:hypothetical protein
MNKKDKIKAKNLYFKQLDSVYNVCKKSEKSYGYNSVPLSFLKNCIDNFIYKKTDENKNIYEWIDLNNKMWNQIYDSIEKRAKELGNKIVNIKTLKLVINTVKKSYKQGLNI